MLSCCATAVPPLGLSGPSTKFTAVGKWLEAQSKIVGPKATDVGLGGDVVGVRYLKLVVAIVAFASKRSIDEQVVGLKG